MATAGDYEDEEEYYYMGRRGQSVALIFNHREYDRRRRGAIEPRQGTEHDARRLEETFRALGFQVRRYDDLTVAQIKETLMEVAREDHLDRNCLVVALMTHGYEKGVVCAKDADYSLNVFWEQLAESPTLAGKPKIIVVQACRGDAELQAFDEGFCIPGEPDFIVSYASFHNQTAYRIEERGSPFIQTLCDELGDRGRTCDLQAVLTRVTGRVVRELKLQVPQFYSSSNRNLRF